MKRQQLEMSKIVRPLWVTPLLLSLVVSSGFSTMQKVQAQPSLPPPPRPPGAAPAPSTSTTPDSATRDENGGLVSAKTKMKFAEANPEDITNENFPDLIESFDYPNADIADVIKAISELTGKNFIVDPQVRGKITIIAPSRITVAEAYKAFLSALAINSMTVVPSGSFLKIKTARNAQRDSIETYSGEYFPNTDQMITRIIKLKYISADEVNKNLRILPSKDGEMVPYPQTNSIIISDYGSNIERVMKIINEIDVPGFEEQLEVIRIKYAKSKDIAELINQIINKGDAGQKFGPGVPRFRRTTPDADSSAGSESYSLVIADDRTNSIVVVGNKAGTLKIRELVKKLDFRLRPEDQGGVFVYYVRHSEAETIANTLNGIATESKKALDDTQSNRSGPPATNPNTGMVTASSSAIFGGDVNVVADKNTNSLIITASRPDYEIVKNLLSKIDIARDQVFVKVIIMEMNSQDQTVWGVDVYKFAPDTNGIGRIGFRGSDSLGTLLSPENDRGAILGFGSGEVFDLKTPAGTIQVSSLAGLIRFLKGNVNANILSTPQIMALDNEESEIEVGENVPVASNTSTATNGTTSSNIQFKDATIKLVLTPYISPDTDSVQMKIDQQVSQLSNTTVTASELNQRAVATTTRKIKTQIVVNSGDTAVLGGLMSDEESENVTKVPVLGDIPIIGWLFKSKNMSKVKRNLVVFLTPRIVRSQEESSAILSEKLNERIDFIQKNMKGRDVHGEVIDNLPRKALSSPTPDQFNEEPAIETF